MAESTARIVGSGWTRFSVNGVPLAWARTVNDTAPRPVGAGNEDIHPMDKPHPVEIVTARAVGTGQLTIQMYELWNQNVWETLPGFAGARSLLDVFVRQVNLGEIVIQKIIRAPAERGGDRVKNYYGCTIISVDESESVDLNTLSVPKSMTIKYTHAQWI